jgi:hypothetical protein
MLALLGYLYGRVGQREKALSIQDSLRSRWENGALDAYYLAFVPSALEDRDQAFAWLDRAYEDGSLGLLSGLQVGLTDPLFDDLRQDPRLEQLHELLKLQKR